MILYATLLLFSMHRVFISTQNNTKFEQQILQILRCDDKSEKNSDRSLKKLTHSVFRAS